MRIVCPKCELKGQVDIVPAGAKTRVACVRCATTFDTIFVDGEIKALLPQTALAVAAVESAGSEVLAGGHVSTAVANIMSASVLPQESEFDAPLQVEESPVSEEDDFSLPSQDLWSEESLETAQAAPREVSHEVTSLGVETWTHEATSAGQDFIAAAVPVKPDGASKVGRPASDAYGMGVRLMRVSPVRLLLAGLSFIAFIVFCNWLIKPTTQPADTARLIATANNHATNQSANRVLPTAPSAQLPVERHADQRSNESGVAFIAAEAKKSTPPPAAIAPSVEPVAAKPAVEEKPAAAPNRVSEAKAGKITIQVGSYNAAAEAEARVTNLRSAGFEARSVAVEIPKRGTWYRVQSGRFVSRDEAERYGRQLRDKGIVSSFITTDVQE